MKRIAILLILAMSACLAQAQEVSFKDTIAAYNKRRIKVNKTGMEALGAWGIINIAGGAVGYFSATQQEWKYFYEMDALWGAVNTGIAAAGLAGVRKEMAKNLTDQQAYDRYRANKKLYLINAGLDVLYIGTGAALDAIGNSSPRNNDLLMGFGNSFVVQGVFLLLFDNVMFASHQKSNSNWYRLMNEVRFSKNSIGINHTF